MFLKLCIKLDDDSLRKLSWFDDTAILAHRL